MSQTGLDVLLLGDYCCDMIFSGLSELPALGVDVHGTGFDMTPGGAYITVHALHRLGLRTGWVTDFGNDSFSQFVLDAAREAGIDTKLCRIHDQSYRVISVVFSLPEDRGFITYYDPFTPSPPADDLIEQHRPHVLLLTDFRLGKENPSLITAARENGTVVYLDSQFTTATLDSPGVQETLAAVDIFAPNASEALQLTGQASVEDALACLAEFTPTVIIKHGGGGALMQTGAHAISAPAIAVDVVDTTGAGDCFNAGFIYAYLRGKSPEDCLRYGNICGGLSTSVRGGIAAAPTVQQIFAHL